MAKKVKSALIVIISVFMLVVSALLLLCLQPVQQKIADIAIAELTKITKNRVSVGRAKVVSLRKITLNEVYIEDMQGDTLIAAETLEAKFRFWPLFKKKILIKSARLSDFTLNIGKPSPDTSFNYQFLIDAFLPDTTKTSSSTVLFRIDKIILENGILNYNIDYEPIIDSDLMDFNHLQVSNINAEVAPKTNDFSEFDIISLSFSEKCGFIINDLSAKLSIENNRFLFSNLQIRLPNSKLTADQSFIDLDLNCRFNVSADSVCPSDFKYFTPVLNDYTDNVVLKGTMEGRLPDFKLNLSDARYGNLYRVSGTASYRSNGEMEFDIESLGRTLPLKTAGSLIYNTSNKKAKISASLSDFRPNDFHLLTQYPHSAISGQFDADIDGFDLDSMRTVLIINNLVFNTGQGKGAISDSLIAINYSAEKGGAKFLSLESSLFDFEGKGKFSFNNLTNSFINSYLSLFRTDKISRRQARHIENFDFSLQMKNASALADALGLNFSVPDSAKIESSYSVEDTVSNLNLYLYCIYNQNDTLNCKINLSNPQQTMQAKLAAISLSPENSIKTDLEFDIEAKQASKLSPVEWDFALKQGSIALNETNLTILPANIAITANRFDIQEFTLQHSETEFIKLTGTISENDADSALLSIRNFQIGTALELMRNRLPLSGIASGDIALSRLSSAPRAFTRNFAIDSIRFDNYQVGNLTLTSGWNSERQAVFFRAALNNADMPESTVSGFVLPEKDSMIVNGDIKGLKIKWLSDYVASAVFGLDGEAGAKISATGLISDPEISGKIYIDKAVAGILKTGAVYEITDSVEFTPQIFKFNNFTITDKKSQKAVVNGSIQHTRFADLKPNLKVDFTNFSFLDNAQQTDSLIFGNLNASGRMTVTKDTKNWLIAGNLANTNNNSLTFNLLETATEARRYNWLTFTTFDTLPEIIDYDSVIVSENTASTAHSDNRHYFETPSNNTTKTSDLQTSFSLPVKINLSLAVNNSLIINALYNQSTGDKVQAQGSGTIDLGYDLNNSTMTMQGNYKIDNGKCTFTIPNFTKKNFTIEEGGKLTFNGDPMKTTFNVAADYNLKASPKTLDQGFAELTDYSKIPVSCRLSAIGDLDRMKLDYSIVLPDETNEIQKKLDALLYSDDMKIKQIAYLLAFGSFAPLGNDSQTEQSGSNIWTTLASSSISSQLNNLLSGVLKDNWTIGAELHSEDGNFQNVAMDVNISTSLFNDRLTVSSTLGFKNGNAVQTDETNNNITGDFDLEYKLNQSGNLAVRFFNLTNSEFYEKARTTQGAGLLYKRKGKTFRQLFGKW